MSSSLSLSCSPASSVESRSSIRDEAQLLQIRQKQDEMKDQLQLMLSQESSRYQTVNYLMGYDASNEAGVMNGHWRAKMASWGFACK